MTGEPNLGALQQGWEDAYQRQADGPLWQDEAIPVIESAVAELRTRQARTVVDLGCGDGRNLAVLLDAGLNALGVDIAPTGLAHARRVVRQRGFLLHADATRIPLIDGSVDAVTCFDVFGQVADPADLVAEAHRLLRAGGLFVANAFTLEDETFGEGDRIAENTFAYRDTLFRYYAEAEMRALFTDWNLLDLQRVSWDDPPHGEFRPYPHRHDNWVVQATPRDDER
ncbi:class I SAM-dependent methyltransferase [Frankia sp. AgKG'84/4]|uniref:class I SAM-dependent methyltransferase n=1 Tax=Frankia sp. AgKG'84/4 TaxID=573490 RepID=UPI0020107C84|nr:class I SAM-dependent methyltransferase [Frankia sp. AgKG'84/4]MCL9793432.1 class I SAM-dependent methyltransferase [Frankia sp. AgKG'84/4]